MDFQRLIYLDGIERVTATLDVDLATTLLSDWSKEAKNRNMAAAACSFMSNYLIPSISGSPTRALPDWIKEMLFEVPKQPTDIPSFLKLFGSNYVESLDERNRSHGIEIPVNSNWDEVVTNNRAIHRGTYFTPNPISGTKVSKNGSRRLDENVTHVSAAYADFDGGDKMSQMLTIGMQITPTMIVESKNGYHAYWFTEPDLSVEDWRLIQKAIIKAFGSDQSIKNPSRLMRLPFTWHCKTDPDFMVKIVAFNWRRYSKLELFQAFDVQPPPPPRPPRPMPEFTRGLKTPAMTSLGAGSRHGSLEEETARAYAKVPQEMAQGVREMIRIWYQHSCSPLKPTWEKEVNDMCDWVERKEYGSVVSSS